MTAPLTPADCDLRDFQFMPLDIVRLFGSRFHAVASDAEWRAGITLWLKSFHQVPAASIPDDDVELARLAELGRDVKSWKKLRAGALHGWIKCDDGRFYHPVVAEKANEAFAKKEFYRERSKKANAKRWGGSQEENAAREPSKADDASAPETIGEGQQEASFKHSNEQSLAPPPASQGTVKGQGEGEKEEGKEEVQAEPIEPVGSAASSYAFTGTTVRLNDLDLARWRKTYHAVPDIEAELTSIDAWWQNQPEPKRKAWFHATAGMLNRKHQEALSVAKAAAVPGDYELPIA